MNSDIIVLYDSEPGMKLSQALGDNQKHFSIQKHPNTK